jgi:hypothetical protein
VRDQALIVIQTDASNPSDFEEYDAISVFVASAMGKIGRHDVPNEAWADLLPTCCSIISASTAEGVIHPWTIRAIRVIHELFSEFSSRRIGPCRVQMKQIAGQCITMTSEWLRFALGTFAEGGRPGLLFASLNIKLHTIILRYGSPSDCFLSKTVYSSVLEDLVYSYDFGTQPSSMSKNSSFLRVRRNLARCLRDVLFQHEGDLLQFADSRTSRGEERCHQDNAWGREMWVSVSQSFLRIVEADDDDDDVDVDVDAVKEVIIALNFLAHRGFVTMVSCDVAVEIVKSLMSKYIVLSEEEFNFWKANAEGYFMEEQRESPDVSVRAASLKLVESLLGQFQQDLGPFFAEAISNYESLGSHSICEALLQIGVACWYDLFDYVDFYSVLSNLFLPRLHSFLVTMNRPQDAREKSGKEDDWWEEVPEIRRIIEFIGKWTEKIPREMRGTLYPSLVDLVRFPDFVVRLTTLEALCRLIDDIEFVSSDFEEYFQSFIDVLFLHAEECHEEDSWLIITYCLKTVARAISSEALRPYFDDLFHRCSVLWSLPTLSPPFRGSVLGIVEVILLSLAEASDTSSQSSTESMPMNHPAVESIVLPMIFAATDLQSEECVYAIETGLVAWRTVTRNSYSLSEGLVSLFPNLLANLSAETEKISLLVPLMEDYLALDHSGLLIEKHGVEWDRSFRAILESVNDNGVALLLGCFHATLMRYPQFMDTFRENTLNYIFMKFARRISPSEQNMVMVHYVPLVFRVLHTNEDLFFSMIDDQLVTLFFMFVMDNIDHLSSMWKKKLICLATPKILTRLCDAALLGWIMNLVTDVQTELHTEDGQERLRHEYACFPPLLHVACKLTMFIRIGGLYCIQMCDD